MAHVEVCLSSPCVDGPSVCTGIEWSADGSVLAACQAGSAVVVLWSSDTHKVQYLDTNIKDVSTLAWSHFGLQVRNHARSKCSVVAVSLLTVLCGQLAIATGKGTLLLYNHATAARSTCPNRHKQRIVCVAWGEDDKVVAFASEDKQVRVVVRCEVGFP